MSSPIFSKVQADYAATSLFNLSHEVKNTTKFGRLTPFLCQEVLPGDTWRVRTEILTRLLALKAPIMHNVDVYTHFFFVPYRIIWKLWEEYVTQSLNGKHSGEVNVLPYFSLHPSSNAKLVGIGSLYDYLGVKTYSTNSAVPTGDQNLCILPALAYWRIWQDYYRDENLDPDLPEELWDLPAGAINDSILDSVLDFGVDTFLTPQYRSWKKDYFTSALPWTQKGEDVTLPLGGTAPVSVDLPRIRSSFESTPNATGVSGTGLTTKRVNPQSGPYTLNGSVGGTSVDFIPYTDRASVDGTVDLSKATAVTINELRRANALQRWSEANARGGTRYIEQLLSHFGVVSDDARLQRAEYLGGGKSPIVISEVLQQSASTIEGSDTPLGNMAGHGISASINHAFKRRFKEHGLVIGIMSVMPRANYMQGVPRMFLKRSVFDFGWPLLANLGEQPIYDQELFNGGSIPADPENQAHVFGYTPRYAEYKFIPDQIAGDFRSSLNFWHMARIFDNPPNLNSSFISTQNFDPRSFATNVSDYVLSQIYLDIKSTRKLPKFGTPRLI